MKIEKYKGFTMMELIVIMVIILILAAGVFYLSPKLIIRQRLKNNGWQLLNDIREVQERARAQLEKLKIEFDLNTKDLYRFENRKDAISNNSTINIVSKKLDKYIYIKSVKIGNTTYGTGIASYMYDEWGAPKQLDNNYIDGEVLIIIETPSLKNSNGENLSIEITVSSGTGTLRMVGPK